MDSKEQNNRVLRNLKDGFDSEQRQSVIDKGEPYGETAVDTVICDRPIRVSEDLSSEQLNLVRRVIQDTNPIIKHCFRNSLEVSNLYPEFSYVEGFAMMDDVEIVFEHAWLSLDGILVDLTIDGFDDYYGIQFSDPELLSTYYEIGVEADTWRILGNHQQRYEDIT